MALQSSGVISLSDLQTEFGGTNPISMSEYYRGGSYVTDNNTGVPTSGTISLSNFYGAVNIFTLNITSNTENANVATLATAAGWDGSQPLICNINSGVYVWSDSTSSAGLIISGTFSGGLTVNNSGYIIGRGGNGGNRTDGYAGGPALSNASSNVTIVNNSGAYIAGGGGGGASSTRGVACGGGGGGAGGGQGGGGTAGGAIGQSGATNGTNMTAGGAGGAGGQSDYDEQSYVGGGGGRILPGTGGTAPNYQYQFGENPKTADYGGNGGGYNSAATAGSFSAGSGGGFWGQAGANGGGKSGGAAGAAISGTAVSLTNNGTIYGTTV